MAYTTIDDPTIYFNTKLHSGNSSTQSITGVGFQPDLTWIKDRTGGNDHQLVDAVRGATKAVSSNRNDTLTFSDGLTSFDSDGYSLGSNTRYNASGSNYVGWNWKANGAGSSNTDGSITSTVSANTTSGFSILTYTGTGSAATVGHGLGAAATSIWIKCTSNADSWTVGHNSNGWGGFLRLDTTQAFGSNTNTWQNTAPTSSVFSINHVDVNTSSRTYVAYCFADKQGFSKFGDYTGNGSTDGPFIFTGFKPAFVMQKNNTTQGWQLQDNKREGYNGDNDLLQPNADSAESGVNRIDILSNGFKVITTDAGQNTSGQKYVYWAFAESPFVTSTGIPTTAR